MKTTMTTRITLLLLTLATAGCDANDAADAKAKGTTAKKVVEIDPAKRAKPVAKPGAEPEARPQAEPDAAPEPDTTPLDDARVAELGGVARRIADAPDQADAILSAHGLDRDGFDAAIKAIAKDPWKTDVYVLAMTASTP